MHAQPYCKASHLSPFQVSNSMSTSGPVQYDYSQAGPQVLIDDKVVIAQKQKALKELSSRVELASAQHNQMYQLQRQHVIDEHQRQMDLTRTSIEDEKAAALMTLEQAYAQNLRAIEQSAQSQRICIEQQANNLEIQSIQHQMAIQHAERERHWTSAYSQPIYQPVQAPAQYFQQISIPMFTGYNNQKQ